MNIETWLQLRREGRLSTMPFGMQTAFASCGDIYLSFYIGENGSGNGGAIRYYSSADNSLVETGHGIGDGLFSKDDGNGDGLGIMHTHENDGNYRHRTYFSDPFVSG